ncbi:MAG TPA: ATP synthase F1 subunit gamma [Phycisphaerales bacterium]|nr:ATP synthase F1 subunit gamma [Phycisphaerales bacterium]HMP38486.1 ATP synthase F1 subunit gamma [Phycisphaerales bacterium]
MAQIRALRKRMLAVRTIARITKTMQMIATAKFTAAQQRVRGTRPYTESIRHLVAEVAAAAGDVEHPLLRPAPAESKRELLLVITSDRGLCGAYNGHVLRTAGGFARSFVARGGTLRVAVAGKKGLAVLKFMKIEVNERLAFGGRPTFAEIEAIAQRLIDGFVKGEYDAVRIAYMKFLSSARQVPEVMQLLPLATEAKAGDENAATKAAATAVYDFSPSARELLDDLLPQSVKISLFQAVNDAIVSEHAMRMVAMKAATDNARGLGKSLSRMYNRARQAKITTELTEIVSGASALE